MIKGKTVIMPVKINRKNATAFFAVIQILYFCTHALVNGYAATYLLSYGFSSGQIGIMLGIGNLCAVGVQLLAASIVSHTGIRIGKVIMVTHVVVAALALALIWIPHGGIVFCIVFVLVFLLTKAMMPMVNSLYYGYHEQGTKINFGVARGLGSGAYSLACLAAGVLVQRFTSGILPWMYIVSCLLLCVAVYIFNAPNTEERTASGVTPREKRILMREYPQFYLFFAGVLCLSTTNGFTETYLPQIIQQIGGTNSDFGVATFISAIVEMPAMFLYRRFADKTGNRKLLIFAGWMWAAKNFLIMLAPTTYLIFAAELLQFVGYAIYIPAGVRYIAHTLPESEFLKGQSLVVSAFTAGCLIAGFVGGPMIDLFGLRATFWGVQLFSVAGVILFTCAMLKSLHMFPSDK